MGPSSSVSKSLPITDREIPSIRKLAELLGLQYAFHKDYTEFMEAARSWRKTYVTARGQPGTELLDWDQDIVQEELSTMAEEFLHFENTGERYWPTRPANRVSNFKYSEDKQEIVELVKQLLWSQNRNADRNSRSKDKRARIKTEPSDQVDPALYNSNTSIGSPLDASTRLQQRHHQGISSAKEHYTSADDKNDSDSAEIARSPDKLWSQETAERIDPLVDIQPSTEDDIFDIFEDSDGIISVSGTPFAASPSTTSKHLPSKRPADDVEDLARKTQKSCFEVSVRRTERIRFPRIRDGFASEEEMMELSGETQMDGDLHDSTQQDPDYKQRRAAKQINTSRTLLNPPSHQKYVAPVTTMGPPDMSKILPSPPKPTSQTWSSYALSETLVGDSQSPQMSSETNRAARNVRIDTIVQNMDPEPSVMQRDEDTRPLAAQTYAASPPPQPETQIHGSISPETIQSMYMAPKINPPVPTMGGVQNQDTRIDITTPNPEDALQSIKVQERSSPEKSASKASKPVVQVPLWIITREPRYGEEYWNDGKIQGTTLSDFIKGVSKFTRRSHIEKLELTLVGLKGVSKFTQRSHIEKLELTLVGPLFDIRDAIIQHREDAWNSAKDNISRKMKLAVREQQLGEVLSFKILIEPIFGQVLPRSSSVEFDDMEFAF